MSDAVFMGCPILTATGRFTGDPKYFDMALRHLNFMRNLCVREDGLYRHSPLDEAPWGRGNGFPALGLALSLTDLEAVLESGEDPERLEPIRDEMLAAFRAHIAALREHQDPTGMWRQVIDHPGSYRELTSTCMITFAILRGIRHGWLDEAEYRPVAGRAWEAIKLRILPDGALFDVCTGTGKQKSLRDYLNRTAILGRDERGGAMALIVAVEMMESSF
jgi:rhamnogalacturonyl hydrolase YesR